MARPSSVPRARNLVRYLLLEHGLSYLADDVELVVSELATNALVHAQTDFWVCLKGFEQTLLLEVEDGSRTGPYRVVAQALDTGGRGLAIVDELTRDWGVDSREGGGKSVWAEFDVHASLSGKRPVARQRGPRAPQPQPQNATEGSTLSCHSEESLSRLLGDVKDARGDLQRVRAKGSREAARAAHAQLVASLTLYVAALSSRHLPVPYLLRDELRIFGRTSAAHEASRWRSP